jgi:hypothetical protein
MSIDIVVQVGGAVQAVHDLGDVLAGGIAREEGRVGGERISMVGEPRRTFTALIEARRRRFARCR